MSDEPIVKKAYYSIGDVCKLAGLKPHVLRYWETQFSALRPKKNRAGNRVYRPKEVELIHLLKRMLYEEGYTIAGADRKLKEVRRAGDLPERRREALAPDILAGMTGELERIRDVLTVPSGDSSPTT
jgi:DNA-binding transcriptional MerR regulator